MIYVYLASLTLANLLVAWLGPWVSPINAFLLIGLDLTLRDRLHDKWQGQNLSLRMGGLILAAGLLSFAINKDAGIIAVASVVAFTISQMLDALVYQKMIRFERWKRVNSSNAVGAGADSLIFPTIAFGGLMPEIVALQFAAKVAGGFIWSLILDSLSRNTNNAQA